MSIKQTITSGDYEAVKKLLSKTAKKIVDMVFRYSERENRWEVYDATDLNARLLYQDGGWIEG